MRSVRGLGAVNGLGPSIRRKDLLVLANSSEREIRPLPLHVARLMLCVQHSAEMQKFQVDVHSSRR
jgi:hypothetical protein